MSETILQIDGLDPVNLEFDKSPDVALDTGIKQEGTTDYNYLANKPSYNGVIWEGNKTFEDVGDYNLTNIEIKEIFNRVFSKGE